jgi:hypothetical protein
MGNYDNLEHDFIERTLALIKQYEDVYPNFHFQEQYNHTLLINCLLGLIVMPKERVITYVPKEQLTQNFKRRIGLNNSWINSDIRTLHDLIVKLRHSVAHFDIKFMSYDERNLIDEIIFNDSENDANYEIIKFKANELLPFVNYYSKLLLENIKKYRINDDM